MATGAGPDAPEDELDDVTLPLMLALEGLPPLETSPRPAARSD